MEIIYVVRLVVALVFLSIASWQDIKTRRVSDKIWWIMISIGGLLLIYDYVWLDGIGLLEIFFAVMLIVMSYCIFVISNKWQRGAFGGADVKAFMCLAVLLPVPFIFGMFPFSYFVIVWAELMAFAWYFPKALKVPRDEWKNITFPLIPFLLFGLIFSFVLNIIQLNMM